MFVINKDSKGIECIEIQDGKVNGNIFTTKDKKKYKLGITAFEDSISARNTLIKILEANCQKKIEEIDNFLKEMSKI